MKVTLVLDDDLADSYAEEATERNLSLTQVLVDRLNRAGELDPRDRYLIVAGRSREQIEALTGGLPLSDVADLTERIRRLASIRFGAHDFHLTPGQMQEVTRLAGRQSKSTARYLQEVWETFTSEFFVRLPGATAAAATLTNTPK